MKRKTALALLLVILMATLAGCKCEHEWQDADCVTPKTCSKCGETEGEALGHTWEEATCEEPRHCIVCGKTEGMALGHDWEEATCTEAKVCKRCEVTEGDPLGHTPGDWEYIGPDYVYARDVSRKFCTVCGRQVDQDVKDLDTLQDGEVFLMSAKDFSTRLGKQLEGIQNAMGEKQNLKTATGTSGNRFACAFLYKDQQIGGLLFENDGVNISASDSSTPGFDVASGYVKSSTSVDNLVRVLTAMVMTCDPSTDYGDATDICVELVTNGFNTVNGITYFFSDFGDSSIFGASIAN